MGGRPSVDNNVTIYPGAIICGELTLQDNCEIGALSYVNNDIERNHIVAGAPVKTLRIKENRDD